MLLPAIFHQNCQAVLAVVSINELMYGSCIFENDHGLIISNRTIGNSLHTSYRSENVERPNPTVIFY